MDQQTRVTASDIIKVGDVYGFLTCLEVGLKKNKRSAGRFSCICGGEIVTELRNVAFNHKRSCGCSHVPDRVGSRVGTFTVISFAHKTKNQVYWNMQCDCGATRCRPIAYSHACQVCSKKLKHGQASKKSRTKEYGIWADMIKRCKHRGNRNSSYLGKGIKVCKRWHDFRNFIADMGPMPEGKHSIDRIDNNGNYEPGNCRWADIIEQANNRSNNHYMIVDGERMTMAQAARKYNISYYALRDRLRRGWSDQEAIHGRN